MIYEFNLPHITDTKNIKKWFLKKKFVPKENIVTLEKCVIDRAHFRENMKYFNGKKTKTNPPDTVYKEIRDYAEQIAVLQNVFENDYPIKNNWKWTPIISTQPILKFSKSIYNGKSGEIIMARLAAFSSYQRQVKPQLDFFKKSFNHIEGEGVGTNLNFSAIKHKDPIVAQLEEFIKEALKAHVDAWVYLSKAYKLSSPQFQILSMYDKSPFEGKSITMEICLQYKSNVDQVGKYAKSIVSQARVLETLLAPYHKEIDPNLIQFISVAGKLYKAIALWSLLFPYTAKIKAEKYDDGESFNRLAGACATFIDHISALHKEITTMPKMKDSPHYAPVLKWFGTVMVDKCQEVAKLYSQVYKDSVYDDAHFQKIKELDYIGGSTREDQLR